MATETTECAVCFDPFNKLTRKPIRCAYCVDKPDAPICCKACTERYLLEDDGSLARCPNPECRTPWSEDFLSDTMTAAFLTGPYKLHREKVLLDQERARLPESQEDAVRYREAQQVLTRLTPEIEARHREFDRNPKVVAWLAAKKEYREWLNKNGWNNDETRRLYEVFRKAADDPAIAEAQSSLLRDIRRIKGDDYGRAKTCVSQYGKAPAERAAVPREAPRNEWTFVMKCTQEGCEGFVGTSWSCGLCKVAFCKDCREPLAVPVESHVCEEEKRLTVAALRKEAKPCPKCAAMISKIDGCDQMWCTQCRTAFSWRTGTIEENHVHNPHYFEWMRRNGGLQPVPQHQQLAGPGADPAACMEPQQVQNQLLRMYVNVGRESIRHNGILAWVRMIRHFEWEGRRLGNQTADTEEERRELRVRRLVNEMDDTAWKVKLQRCEKARNRRQRVRQVLQTFTQAGNDLLRGFLGPGVDQDAVFRQLRDLQTYCNDQLQKIASRYKNEVPWLSYKTFVGEGTYEILYGGTATA